MDLDRLEALAKAALPGPWEYEDRSSDPDAYPWSVATRAPGLSNIPAATGFSPDTAKYIAAVDPETVRALIEVARAAQDVRDSGASMLSMSALSEALAAVERDLDT